MQHWPVKGCKIAVAVVLASDGKWLKNPMDLEKFDADSVTVFVDGMVASGRTPGMGVAVAVSGKPVYHYLAGTAREGIRATPETIWPIASISKLYTAAAAMRLIESGRLTMGAKVCTYLPAFTANGRDAIRVRQLLTHTSGLIYEAPTMDDLISRGASMDELLEPAFTGDLLFEPGTSQLYSDLGYAAVGRILETITGLEFAEVVRTLVLEPAGLHETWTIPPKSVEERFAIVEGSFGSGTANAMYNSDYARGLAHPAFGVSATLADLLRFGLLFDPAATNTIFTRVGVQAMTTDQTGGDLPGEDAIVRTGVIHAWGAGFMIKGESGFPELVSPASYGHGGASGCYLWIDPEWRTTVAIVSRTHYNAAPDDFFPRLDQTLNVVMAATTRG